MTAGVALDAPLDLTGRVEMCAKRVRCVLGGRIVADTRAALLVWEHPYYPAYYIPRRDVNAELVPSARRLNHHVLGRAESYAVHVDGATATDSAWAYVESSIEVIRDHVRFDWYALDEWFEEDEPVYVHPRSPYTRVDILASTRQVQVMVDGVEVASSRQPRILYETGLPPRYYLPITDVRADLLQPSTTMSECPYKGTATYWSLEVNGRRYDDFVWCYRTPHIESIKIAGLACFYNEKVDLVIDGVPLARPKTKFS